MAFPLLEALVLTTSARDCRRGGTTLAIGASTAATRALWRGLALQQMMLPMERRRYIRYSPMKGRAYIYFGKGVPLAECELSNISEGGARIACTSHEMLPAHFVLFLTLDGGDRRTCRVVWRDGAEVGVAFE